MFVYCKFVFILFPERIWRCFKPSENSHEFSIESRRRKEAKGVLHTNNFHFPFSQTYLFIRIILSETKLLKLYRVKIYI